MAEPSPEDAIVLAVALMGLASGKLNRDDVAMMLVAHGVLKLMGRVGGGRR